jgi:hypothetical protein
MPRVVGVDGSSARRKHWTDSKARPLWQHCKSSRPRPPQETQQDCFGPIVRMVRSRKPACSNPCNVCLEGLVAKGPRPRLKVASCYHRNATPIERNVKRARKRLGPVKLAFRLGSKTVVHAVRNEPKVVLSPQKRQYVKQCHRIGTATDGNHSHARARYEHGKAPAYERDECGRVRPSHNGKAR